MPRKPVTALEYAYRLLNYRQRSIRELRNRLHLKGYGEAETEEAVERLKELGFLDDPVFARSLRHRAEEYKHLGRVGAKGYLRRMGIAPAETEAALDGYDELIVARRLVEKKLRNMGPLSDKKVRRRLSGYLQRRGYSSATIRKVLNSEEEDQ